MKHLKNKLRYLDDSDFSVTYKLNKINGIFNWYPYTEGFSKPFVDKMIEFFGATSKDIILDPFSGCGTTSLSCSLKGISSVGIEVNPFMHFIGKSKNKSLKLNLENLKKDYILIKNNYKNVKVENIPSFIKGKPFFNPNNLNQALIIKNSILNSTSKKENQDFFMLHLSSILVKISDMVRAVDLRYRKNKLDKLDVFKIYEDKILKAFNDLENSEIVKNAKATFFNKDICNLNNSLIDYHEKIDFFITSPPYLNGTNYDRNTKLEMGFLDMIKTDSDLKGLRTRMVTAGINSTHSINKYELNLDILDDLLKDVTKNAYDRRIPIMVKGYFNDMSLAIKNIRNLMKEGGKGVIVVGDSQFGGVHIETDIILAKICELLNLKVEAIDVVRERRSKNGMKLRESLIFVRK